MASNVSAPTRGKKRRAGVAPDINVTPLVDVVLVLLIIFMVVTPQMEAGVSVTLPSIRNPDQGNGALEPTTVTLTKNGKFFFEKEERTLDALLVDLEALHAAKPDTRVVLKADKDLEYGKVRAMFKSCQDLGFPGVSLQVIDVANRKS
ncbi:MAG: biopolymer transporter ExbD [Myxococcaceae bacterium]|jgi:biopolymer transport protein TolR|nr:biopolymer transporter ExbD [Myxococcaceae bacterium]MCA3014694.1 biopolymer transporter ExbD [Myxococcaceae bacterium]